MTLRPGMVALVNRVRSLTGAGYEEYDIAEELYWSNEHIEALLDQHRRDILHDPLYAVREYNAAGSLVYTRYVAPHVDWEATTGGSAILLVQHGTGASIAGSLWSFDVLRGEVTFTGDQAGSARNISGRVYDVYAAAADLLETWAGVKAGDFDYSGDGQSLKLTQSPEGLRKQADRYRAQAWVVSTPLSRSDLGDGRWRDGWD